MAGGSDDLVHRVAKRIASVRRERGLSQENLAAILGIAVKNLQRIESGKQNLSLATLERICAALDVNPACLFTSEPPPVEASSLPPVLERLKSGGYSVRAATQRGRRPAHAVPVTTLRAAGGHLAGTARAIDVVGWVTLPRAGPPPEGQFVAEVRGSSMEPKIQSGALCLFGRPGPPPFRDRVLLVAHASLEDDELGGPYALKRVRSTRTLRDGRTRVVLESINPAYSAIVIDAREDELRIIAELVRVLVA